MLGKNTRWQREKCEDQFRDTLLSLNGLSPSLSSLPPSSRFAPTHSHVCPLVLPPPLKTPPPKCHTWTQGKSYAQPDTRLLVDQMTNMFLGICWLQQQLFPLKWRSLSLKVMWIIIRERWVFLCSQMENAGSVENMWGDLTVDNMSLFFGDII